MVQLWPVVLLVFSPSRVSGLKKGKYVQDWPVPVQDINDELVKCGICGGYLGLVAQVLAMYSFLLTFQSPSLLHFVSEMDVANHFFVPIKLDPGSAFLVAQNHVCALYVHCSHLMISTHWLWPLHSMFLHQQSLQSTWDCTYTFHFSCECSLETSGFFHWEFSLVPQIYAPLTLYGSKIDERSLFVLGCPSASCGTERARLVDLFHLMHFCVGIIPIIYFCGMVLLL